MRILYVAMASDYGDATRGQSYEHTNFHSALCGMGHEVVHFDFMEREANVGRRRMQQELVTVATTCRPDLSFFVLYQNQISPRTIGRVAEATGAPTMNWFADDHWRFDNFSRHYAPALNWVVTTDQDAVTRYEALGHSGVILSQWACNRYAYTRVDDELRHDVTFVGQPHGTRRAVIEALQGADIDVECWGRGWPGGRIEHDAMVEIFSTSRINLNLSNSSTAPAGLRHRLGATLRRTRVNRGPRPSQIKGRTFEVPGCGGFLLTDRAPHLERYFDLQREVAVYDDPRELPEQIAYWISHEAERAAVADAGYARVLREHTYDHRFAVIFEQAGLL
jgi:spore maturation protein CgeB